MTIRLVLATFAILLALQTPSVAAGDVAPRSDTAWISFSETPIQSARQQEFHTRATRNTDPKLLKIISAHVSRSTDLRLLLKSYNDAELRFRTDNFLVARIEGVNVTIAAGTEFPDAATRKLAKQLQAMGYHVDSVTPETLLLRNDNQASTEPKFVVPFATESEE